MSIIVAPPGCGSCSGVTDPCCVAAPSVSSGSVSVNVCAAISHTFTASNYPTSYGFSPGLPGGLSFNILGGGFYSITGSLSAPYSGVITISAINGCGTGTGTLTLTVACPSPTLVADAVAASLTKCGWGENPGYESSPHKIYLKREWNGGTITDSFYSGCSTFVSSSSETYAGSCEYDPDDCSVPSTGLTVNGSAVSCSSVFLAGVFCPSGDDGTHTVTATTITVTGSGGCHANHLFSGSAVETLSVEYTTALLISNTQAAMPSFPGTWGDSPVTIRNLSIDESSYSEQQSRYKFTLPSLPGIVTYVIDWIERFTPEGGGSPTDTAKSYTWDGVASETGIYTLPVPTSEGSITVVDVVVTCTC